YCFARTPDWRCRHTQRGAGIILGSMGPIWCFCLGLHRFIYFKLILPRFAHALLWRSPWFPSDVSCRLLFMRRVALRVNSLGRLACRQPMVDLSKWDRLSRDASNEHSKSIWSRTDTYLCRRGSVGDFRAPIQSVDRFEAVRVSEQANDFDDIHRHRVQNRCWKIRNNNAAAFSRKKADC